MHIILDGVFNHTGDDSKYFNKNGRYGTGGAYRDKNSPYRSWYSFTQYPDSYESWWGIEILPRLSTANPAVEEYLAGENGIAAKYLKKGISGLRLDVADELPDSFLSRHIISDRFIACLYSCLNLIFITSFHCLCA